jgi:DNA-binding MltR family transcriptional regulator
MLIRHRQLAILDGVEPDRNLPRIIADRTAAIIAATVVEARLSSALEKRFQRDEKIQSEFFRSSGPLGSFSAKIDLAYLMGSLTKDAWHDLDLMKNIRNKFADPDRCSKFPNATDTRLSTS